MKIKNLCEIKAIDETRAVKIINWYNKADYRIGVMASPEGPGVNLGIDELIELLTILANSENIKKDFREFMMSLGFSGKG